ncbi:KRI1-like family C-terminal-domain-containing protein [Desarmillaria tabescens]|uniref:KRI1-like family C-terminal-domain-containing protein n=1 Tax=Armillaria tabescens TaxID=1929756 RepID=A0AA39KE35_ARMTA|nr:KRI1-like family C-terminal-domain-containing protein [Desarmillaria tabescens]KAK0459472.1 KRI1-like family C-terminal-domain-containing protein [Desarmillaria tabescens]
MLSDSESDNESTHQLTINEHYAKAFQYRKEREELEKLKAKYGSDAEEDDDNDETDSESAESEDEDGEELTPAVDAAILRTLARIKRKDPDIYNSEKSIFGEEQTLSVPSQPTARTKIKQSKPVTLRQVVLESTLNPTSRSPSPELTHVEAQRELRKETIAAFHGGEAERDDDDLLVPREKTKDEQEEEEEEYRDFLQREVGGDLKDLITIRDSEDGDREPKQEDTPKKSKKKSKKTANKKSKEEEDQKFLMNYILNRGWIDRSSTHIPTYQEATSSRTKGKGKAKKEEKDDEDEAGSTSDNHDLPTADPEIDEDEFEDIVDRFESSYNFRFEEPDAAEIKGYPRNIPSLVRREDTTRKDARERRKMRKEEELQKKKEEVRRLKSLKMKEIRNKLDRIGPLEALDLDADWDSEAHDAQMEELYGADEEVEDVEKPVWDDDIDIGDIVVSDDEQKSKKKKKRKKKKGVEEEDVGGVDVDAMDADLEHGDEEWDGTEEMRKKKLDEYMNELYELDFNDMVGGMPTRFKYTPVQAQNFALTPAEILMATDAELNEYMGVKKYAPYRKDNTWDAKRGEKLKELKNKIAARSSAGASLLDAEKPAKKRKGKKERMRSKAGAAADQRFEEPKDDAVVPDANLKRKQPDEDAAPEQGKKKKRRHRKNATEISS